MDAPYNPITGHGSPIPRKELSYSIHGSQVGFMAPVTMFDEAIIKVLDGSSVENLLSQTGKYNQNDVENFQYQIIKLRHKHDFEFWAATCVQIPDKETENLVNLRPNRPQKKLLKTFEKQRVANDPIRVVIDKARQWGGSTLTQVYMDWIQLFHKTNWNMAICTLVDDQARHIGYMFDRIIENYPEEFGKIKLKSYARSPKNRVIEGRGGIIGIGSIEKPEHLRTYNIHMIHMSEVGSWGDTPKKSAKSLVQSLRGTIQRYPYTMVVLESTAKGVGNFFHTEYLNAVEGRSGYTPVFVSWLEIEIYRLPIDDYEKFINNTFFGTDQAKAEYSWFLWDEGATLEGINWYWSHKENESMDDLSMHQEFPTNWRESFESTGRPAFAKTSVKMAEKTCIEPDFIGEINGSSLKGEKAFEDIRFEKNPSGNLFIWSMPDTTIKVANRYCVFADIGGKHKGADYSVAKVLDRYWMIDGGNPEVVAVWHGHGDQDLIAWKFAQISFWYNQALLAVESNSLRKENKDGDHFLTILDEISEFYENLYSRTDPEKIKEGVPTVWGFHTNLKTKPLLVDTLNGALRDQLYVEKDIRAVNEMYQFELKDDGTYGAPEGAKDDQVIATAGVNWLSLKYMPMPVVIQSKQRTSRRIINEASI